MASSKKDSKILDALKGARSLNDVLSAVDLVVNSIKNIEKTTKKVLSSLSSRSITISIADSSIVSLNNVTEREAGDMTRKKSGGKSFKSVLDKASIKVPKAKDLIDGSSLVHDLNQNILELQQALRVLKSKDFSKFDDNAGAVAMIKGQIAKAEALRDEQLAAMSKISKQYTPKEHEAVVRDVAKFLKDELNPESYTRIRKKTFVLSAAKDIIQFQTFLVISDLVNEEGYAYEEYSFVVTGTLNTGTGEFDHYITTLKDPKMPGSFPMGKEIKSTEDAKLKIKLLTNFDDLIVRKNRVNMVRNQRAPKGATGPTGNTQVYVGGQYIPDSNRAALKRVSKYVKRIRAKKNELYVQFDESIGDAAKKNLIKQLVPLVKAIFLPPRAKSTHLQWREVTGKISGKSYFVFSLVKNEDPRSQKFISKVTELADQLQMSPQTTREVIRDIVNRHEP